MGTGRCVDELSRHSNAIAGSADTTFQDIAHTEVPAHQAHVNCFASISEAGVAGNDEQPAQFRQSPAKIRRFLAGWQQFLRPISLATAPSWVQMKPARFAVSRSIRRSQSSRSTAAASLI